MPIWITCPAFTGNDLASVDACVLELEVFAATDELQFEFVFGSEEYPEWVNQASTIYSLSSFPGPASMAIPISASSKILPFCRYRYTVQIDSVNNFQNWHYYRDNSRGHSIEFDGLTSGFLGRKKTLTARADVQPCNTYRLKLAIARPGDAQFDSGVFIGEIGSVQAQLSVQYGGSLQSLVEDCSDGSDSIRLSFDAPLSRDLTFQVEIKGTAGQGTDYLLPLGDTLSLEAGSLGLSLPLQALADSLNEPTEQIVICLVNDFGCGRYVYDSLVIDLFDRPDIRIDSVPDSLRFLPGSLPGTERIGAH